MADRETSDVSPALREFVERAYRLQIRDVSPLSGGYESAVYRLECADRACVLRMGAPWRSLEALHLSYAAVARAAERIPEIPAPHVAADGAMVLRHANRPISLWPFVEGRNVDLDNPVEALLAAEALARLHRELSLCGAFRDAQTPGGQTGGMQSAFVKDEELDRWLAGHAQRVGPTHGDYWRNNLVFRGDRIVGVIDWDDARMANVERELSAAVWEFCGDPFKGVLNTSRAAEFLDVYEQSGGPVLLHDRRFIIPFIRDYLRSEIERALSAGEDVQGGSLDGSLRAFSDLRNTWLY